MLRKRAARNPKNRLRISRSTSLPAEGEYLRPEDFFALLELDFLEEEPRVLFFAPVLRVLFFVLLPRVLFFALLLFLLRVERLELLLDDPPLELLLDFFLAAFFVAITILLGGQMAGSLGRVACIRARRVAGFCAAGVCAITQCGEFPGCAQADRR